MSKEPDLQPLSDDELARMAQQISDAEDTWLEATRQTTQTVTCPECGGSGDISFGSLGSGCYACGGRGVVTDEFAESEPLALPTELKQVRLDYKHIAGLLDAAHASERAGKTGKRPTRRDAARLIQGVRGLKDIRAKAKDAVRGHRSALASGGDSAKDDKISELERRLEQLERKGLGGGGEND